jgi:hypothetical protein
MGQIHIVMGPTNIAFRFRDDLSPLLSALRQEDRIKKPALGDKGFAIFLCALDARLEPSGSSILSRSFPLVFPRGAYFWCYRRAQIGIYNIIHSLCF